MTHEVSKFVDWGNILRPGDQVICSQAAGEPLTLIESLMEHCSDGVPISLFMGASFANTLAARQVGLVKFRSFGAIGTMRRLAKASVLDIIPCHVSRIADYIRTGDLACDVALVQLSAEGPDATLSFGVTNDYVQAAIEKARVVVAEVNDRVPWTHCDEVVPLSKIDVIVRSSRPLPEVLPSNLSEVEHGIARHAAPFILDGAVLQIGIGSIPQAILECIRDRRDLGIHSGMISDGVMRLIEAGTINNARKPFDKGISVTGTLIGSQKLYEFANRNSGIMMRQSRYTHSERVLSQLPQLTTVNSALEIDLTGQVNAETVGFEYVGGIGGQADFVRAGHRSAGGKSIIVLPSTAKGGLRSRICATLAGPVTTGRGDTDVVVTEFGSAELRARSIGERTRSLINIAHPAFQSELERSAYEQGLLRH